MRKVSMLIAAITLAGPAPLVISTPAQAGYNNIPAYCKNYVASHDNSISQGQCISLITSEFHYFNDDQKGGNSYAEKACDFYAEVSPDFFDSMWTSKQECMTEILSLP
jgi:hypothetical protein